MKMPSTTLERDDFLSDIILFFLVETAKVKYKVFRCGNVIGNVTNHFCLYLSNLLFLTKYNINYF